MELKRRPRGDKVYRGAYRYFKGETVYCEEEFEVYKDRKELGLTFFANLTSRVATGELLSIYVDYQISKDFIPQKVLIEKSLGKDFVTEIYDFDKKKGHVDYLFITKKDKNHTQITCPPKFSITTPCACTSMLSLKTKKEDTTSKNYYQLISSRNNWKFEEGPYPSSMTLERVGLGTEGILIEGQTVQATVYRLFSGEDLEKAEDINALPTLKVYLSKFAAIPYQIKSQSGEKIQIKYLNNLDKD